jgi:hypothetical protein
MPSRHTSLCLYYRTHHLRIKFVILICIKIPSAGKLTITLSKGGFFMSLQQRNRNNLVVPGVESVLNQMKLEIAQELGVQLGATTSSRENGRVGGEITKRLVSMAQGHLH